MFTSRGGALGAGPGQSGRAGARGGLSVAPISTPRKMLNLIQICSFYYHIKKKRGGGRGLRPL
jgi:hypothetical protein